jgi:hypothetical protein
MHWLEDMRIIEDDWTFKKYVCEVDENGQATYVLQVDTFPDAIPQSARPIGEPLYQCRCGEEFDSWEEAKAHINWGGE